MTRQSPGTDHEQWQSWWKDKKDYFNKDKYLREIGEKYGKSRERIRVILDGAKEKLTNCTSLDELKTVYMKLPKDQMNNELVISYKDEMKGLLS